MTQILTAASLRSVVQVSDRLVTTNGASFDPLANKTVILIASDGVIVMSYTGQAFLDGVPTDQWIAEILKGERFDRSRKPPAFGDGSPIFTDLGRNLKLLTKSISEAATRLGAVKIDQLRRWYREPFEISFAGWQRYREDLFRPIIGTIQKPTLELRTQLVYHLRSELLCGKLAFQCVPKGHAPREEFRKFVRDTLCRFPHSQWYRVNGSASDAEKALVSQIRLIAGTTPLVGPDCMSVAIPYGFGPVFVEYFPVHEQQADLISRNATLRIKVAFSPWVIAQGGFSSPSLLNDVSTFQLRNVEVIMNGPRSSGLSVFSSQRRPAEPSGHLS